MIIQTQIPLPTSPLIGADPLGFLSNQATKKPEEQRPDPEVSLLEEEALREHLASIGGDNRPISDPQAMMERGYLDADGNATKAGEDYLLLEEQGLFNENGQLTPKGQAFAMDRGDSLLQENLPAYKIRQKAGLDQAPETSLGEDISNVAGFLWDGLKGVSKLADMKRIMSLPFSQEARDEQALLSESAAKGVLSGGAQLGSGGLEMIQKALAADDSDEYWAAKQRGDRFSEDLKNISGGEIYGHLLGSQQIVDSTVQAREGAFQRLGQDQAASLERQGEAAGQVFGDPANYLTAGVGATVGGGSKAGFLARLGTKVDDAMQAGLRSTEAATALAKAESQALKARNGAQLAAQQAENLRSIGKVERAAEFEAVERRLASVVDEADASIPALRETMQSSAMEAQRLAESAGGAQKILGTIEQAKAAGRQFRAAPARIAAPVLEGIATGIEKLDSAIPAMRRARDVAAWVGVIHGNPLAAIPAALPVAGPVLRQLGGLSRVLGDELIQARGTVPFWRRVAENTAASPLAKAVGHGMDFATLGGKVPSVLGRTAKGVAAAVPMNAAFDMISQGGDTNGSLRRGLAQSLVFAGPAAMAGGIVSGHRNDLLAKQAGDEINFRQRIEPAQKDAFNRMDAGTRRMASTYSAAFPALRFEFVEDGPSSFNRQTNTARVNVRQKDALRPLLSHEVNHFIEASGQIGEGIRSMLLGDRDNGGLLRRKNGNLDPQFKAFADEYNTRLANENLPHLALDDMALEYFNEATVDQLMADLGSGRLQQRKTRSEGQKAISRVIEATIPKSAMMRNLFLRTGGALDGNGKPVMGNGILESGLINTPGMTRLMRKGMERAFDSSRTSATPSLPPIDIVRAASDPTIRETLFSEFETYPDGTPVTDANGRAKVLTPEQQAAKAKETANAARKEIETEIIQNADAAAKGEKPEPIADPILAEFEKSETPQQKERRVRPAARGKYQGTHLSARTLLGLRKTLNKEQFKVLLMLNRASRDMSGETFHTIYNPATKRDARGSPKYASRGPESYEVIPYAIHINKAGGIFFELIDVRRLMSNLRERAASEKGKRLYQGNENALLQDVEAMVNLRRDNQPTDGYFKQKYGDQWQAHKNFVSSVFGNFKDKVQLEKNPDIGDLDYKDTNTVKTFRIDRLNQTDRLQGRVSLPFNYENAKINLFPRGQ